MCTREGDQNTSRCPACVGRGGYFEDKQMPAPLNWFRRTTSSYAKPVAVVEVVVVVVVVVVVAVVAVVAVIVVVVVVVVVVVAVVAHSRMC